MNYWVNIGKNLPLPSDNRLTRTGPHESDAFEKLIVTFLLVFEIIH